MLFRRRSDAKQAIALKAEINMNNIPQHIAIIMDGNGRWAKKRSMPRTYGHRVAVETIKEIVSTSSELGIKYLTLYAFSTENWKRPVDEVNALMELLVEFLIKELEELNENNVLINYIGDISALPQICQETLVESHNKTIKNDGLVLNLGLNYGSRAELGGAIKKIAASVKNNEIKIDDIDDALISSYLYTNGMPDPDIMIRTSGEYRISNFLLWQIAYSELWFTEVLWPDFRKEHLFEAILDYQRRDRRYGGIKK
jgi:undecaprenyl diphosphate synthase